LLALDPLHHFVRAEEYLTADESEGRTAFMGALGGEFPEQSLLELAVGYTGMGLKEDALAVLELGEEFTVLRAWRAYLSQDPSLLFHTPDPAFAFPYRPESLPVLEWAAENGNDWVWRYLLALNLWAVNRDQQAAELFAALGQTPDFGPFYVARGILLAQTQGADPEADLRKAVELGPENRTLHIHLIRHLENVERWEEALAALDRTMNRFPGDFNLELLKAKALIHTSRAVEATRIMAAVHVLPSENGRESHRLYEQAHTLAALDALEAGALGSAKEHLMAALRWPESLGQGRPYEPEERLVRFLLGRVEEGRGNTEAAEEAFQAVVDATGALKGPPRSLDLLAAPALQALGRTMDVEGLRRFGNAEAKAVREGLSDSLEGRMILRALSLTE